MNVLWDHLMVGQLENLPHYDTAGGLVATWQNNHFLQWVEAPKGESGTVLHLVWSPLGSPAHWAAVVRWLLDFNTGYPDAIVAYAWTGDLLQVAVGRTTLMEGGEEPEWFRTGQVPKTTGMRITGTDRRLMLSGHPTDVLWEVVGPLALKGAYVWPTNGVHGFLPTKPGSFGPSMNLATGKVSARDVDVVEVTTPVVSIRNGMSVHPGPEGFRMETLIVVNPNGSWSPVPVWVGQQLDLNTGHPSARPLEVPPSQRRDPHGP